MGNVTISPAPYPPPVSLVYLNERGDGGMNNRTLHVLLAKEAKQPDQYLQAFQTQFSSTHILKFSYLPVLSLRPTTTAIQDATRLLHSPATLPLGIICTSQHATNILAQVLAALPANHPARTQLVYFVVGASTAAPLCHLHITNIVGAHNTGNALKLSSLVIEHYNTAAATAAATTTTTTTSSNNNYLFFCGNSRKDTLPTQLASHQIPFVEIQLYQSTAIAPQDLQWPLTAPDWMVFFSPNGVRAALAGSSTAPWPWVFPKHAAIGGTTGSCMSSVGISLDCVPSQPNPIALSACLFALESAMDYYGAASKPPWVEVLAACCFDDASLTSLSFTSKRFFRWFYFKIQKHPKENIPNTSR